MTGEEGAGGRFGHIPEPRLVEMRDVGQDGELFHPPDRAFPKGVRPSGQPDRQP